MEQKSLTRINNLIKQLDFEIKEIENEEFENNNEKKEKILEKFFTKNHFEKNKNDIVVVCPCRTAIGKAKKGGFKDTPADKLLQPIFEYILKKTKIDPTLIGDVVIGKVNGNSGQGATQVRIASLMAGLDEGTPCSTVNRQCSSGLQAVAQVASAINSGFYEIGIAGGVESMSLDEMPSPKTMQGQINMEAMKHKFAKGCYLSMGQTSENVAVKYNISRETQDFYAFESQKRAKKAQDEGKFKEEIVPITTTVKDNEGKLQKVTVDQDEGVRETTKEALEKLKPVFSKTGTTTAGNSSQVSDGAAAMLLMTRQKANELGLEIIGTFRGFAVQGCDPHIMGIGPAVAIPKVLKQCKLDVDDIDLFEINEAFASQYAYCLENLKIPNEKANVNGGAIALGHPLGCTGARLVSTLLYELRRRKKKLGIISMCIGTGMGAAGVFEAELN